MIGRAALVWALLPAMFLVSPLLAGEGTAQAGEATTVFLVRHAERADDDPRDPHLSETGRERAAALAGLLGHAGVTHLFASEYRRTIETLEPLAARTGVEIVVTPAREGERLSKALRALPGGSVAVVAGHSNTVPELVRGLGGSLTETTLDEAQYDRLFVVLLSSDPEAAAIRTLDLRYEP